MSANHTAADSTVSALSRKGFKVNSTDSETFYMSRKRGALTNYAQVDCYDGLTVTVNGMSLADFLKSL